MQLGIEKSGGLCNDGGARQKFGVLFFRARFPPPYETPTDDIIARGLPSYVRTSVSQMDV